MSKLLDKINKPNDIKKIPQEKYEDLAKEIREFLIDTVSKTGGHLASNLGVVELTIALHAVLSLPEDKIVWDVGHQTYTHKILTGRKDSFDSLRKMDGLSGFPKRRESECDCFNTGHSSTSISAGLGMAQANLLKGSDGKVVVVIGDGALTGGMALEALNNVASLKRNFVIILNDNNMSISENVGGMSNYLNKFRVGEHYNDFKADVENSLSKIPKVGNKLVRKVKRAKDNFKNIVLPGGLFDDLGVTYIGPIDGHNINQLITILGNALKIDHPIVIHLKTIKGRGYKYAEENPSKFHGINPFDIDTGIEKNIAKKKTYTDVFSDTLVEMAKTDKKIVAITAAMPDGTGLSKFQKKYPDRFFDVGIAEEHAVTFGAGLAASGYKPFISIYSSFFQRAYDQILHDVCLQNLPVTLIFDRSGLVGQDGETHQGIFDISFMSAMPNITIIAPKSGKELRQSLLLAQSTEGPVAIRFAKGAAYQGDEKRDTTYNENNFQLEYGKSEILSSGQNIALIAVGSMVEETLKATEKLNADGIYPTVINARFIKPLDCQMIKTVAENNNYVIVIEEGIKKGGYGESVEAYIAEHKFKTNICVMAINDSFVEQGAVGDLRKRLKIDYTSIYKKVLDLIK